MQLVSVLVYLSMGQIDLELTLYLKHSSLEDMQGRIMVKALDEGVELRPATKG